MRIHARPSWPQSTRALPTATLSKADMTEVKKLRAQGEKLHAAGDHAGSLAALNKAKKMLGI
uniref:hypothetical protein n=1 Tax=Mesorhizobium atlanticum TaxID=2233532 RepID=UPI0037038370